MRHSGASSSNRCSTGPGVCPQRDRTRTKVQVCCSLLCPEKLKPLVLVLSQLVLGPGFSSPPRGNQRYVDPLGSGVLKSSGLWISIGSDPEAQSFLVLVLI